MANNLMDLLSSGIAIMESTQNNGVGNSIRGFMNEQNIPSNRLWKPLIDIAENDTHLVMYIYLAGVNKDDIKIDFYNNKLTIKGRRNQPFINTECKISENVYGPFERSITIPISVTNQSSVTLSNENGVLKICIDKRIEERNRFTMSCVSDNTGEEKATSVD